MTTAAGRAGRAALVLGLIVIATFGAGAPPEECPAVTSDDLRRSARMTVDWFARNQNPDGTWLYLYDRDGDTVAPEYNTVRHAGVTMGLYQAAAAGSPGALRSADRGTEWGLDRLLERDGWAALRAEGRIPVGATALLAAGLDIRREATGDTRHDAVLRRLGRFLVSQTERSGAVLATYDPIAEAPDAGEYSKYYTGEAYWALARLNRTFPNERWGEVADRIGAYLATARDEAEDHWPPIPDHWAAYGQAETVDSRVLTGDEIDYARSQAELFGVQARWVAQRFGPWGELVRGTYTPRGGGYGVISEALTGWWIAAQAEPRLADLRGPIADRATCIAGLALDAQSGAGDAAGAARPERVDGAWFLDGETRMDDQQHALAGLLRTIPIVEVAGRPETDDDAPTAWLWIAVLVLAFNPARAAFAVPRAVRSRREPAVLAAAGAAVGGLAVCLAAVAGDPLLDALDVGEASFRFAAGILAALAGVADLVCRPPSPEPALSGRRAALIPVAFPVVARPALLVLALGAGADAGVLESCAAIVAGVGTVTALAAAGTDGRAARWATRLSAAGLLACGVVLCIEGILAV